MLSNFVHWITLNRANGENFREGRTWTYNTVTAYAELYPYLKKDKIRRTLESLVAQGIMLKGSFNKVATDRTSWHAFADEDAFLPTLHDLANSPNGSGRNQQTHSADLPNGSGKSATSLIRTDVNANVNADSRRGTRLPDDWVLTRAWAKVAFEIWPNWTDEHCRFNADQFRDYWHAKAGKDAAKRDWLATWRNWVRTAGAMKVEKGGAGVRWYDSPEAALVKAREVGVGPAIAGESEKTWHARIRAAIDNGGTPPVPVAYVPPQPTDAPQASGPRPAVSEANRAALLAAAKKAGANRPLGESQ